MTRLCQVGYWFQILHTTLQLYRNVEYLSNINGWVEAVADIHQNVAAEHTEVSCQCVHLHLRARCPVAEVIVHPPLPLLPVKVKVGGTIETLCREVHPVSIGTLHLWTGGSQTAVGLQRYSLSTSKQF